MLIILFVLLLHFCRRGNGKNIDNVHYIVLALTRQSRLLSSRTYGNWTRSAHLYRDMATGPRPSSRHPGSYTGARRASISSKFGYICGPRRLRGSLRYMQPSRCWTCSQPASDPGRL
jgi:hypothetical protein